MNQKRRKKEGTKKNEVKIEQGVDNFADSSLLENTDKPVKSNLKMYFNADTQAAIVAFQKEKNKKNRNSIYVGQIMPAFEKLVENLINIYRFTAVHDSYEDLKNDCVNFLFETTHKFDASRGKNAFSYFNVVAKNWLIIKTKQKSQKLKRNISMDDPLGLSSYESTIVEEHGMVQSPDVIFESITSVDDTVNLLYEIRSKVRTENELSCINSIITIFENIDEIDLMNKGAVLLYMRELSGLTSKQLTTTMQSIKRHYKKTKLDNKNQ